MNAIQQAAGGLMVAAIILAIAVAVDHMIEARRRKKMDAWRRNKK